MNMKFRYLTVQQQMSSACPHEGVTAEEEEEEDSRLDVKHRGEALTGEQGSNLLISRPFRAT